MSGNTKQQAFKYPVLILGAGRGGSALLGMFVEDKLVDVIGIVDTHEDAPGLALARSYGIPTYDNNADALSACKAYPDCIIYNLTNDDAVVKEVHKILGDKRVAAGIEGRLFWQMVTNLKQLKSDLERSQNHLQAIIHNVVDGIITANEDGIVRGFNPAAEQIFGYVQKEVIGQSVAMLLPQADHSEHAAYFEMYFKDVLAGSLAARRLEVRAQRKDGVTFPMEIALSDMVLNGQRFFTAIVRDITERKLAEQRLAHLAHYDFLTNLPNRALFLERLDYSMTLARRGGYQLALLFLDLDGFKNINDLHGHEVGDWMLKAVADRLQQSVRPSDTVARMGGDEFVFLLNNVGNRENVAQIAQKIRSLLEEPFVLQDGLSYRIGASIGMSFFDGAEIEPDTLLNEADRAMYLEKKKLNRTT